MQRILVDRRLDKMVLPSAHAVSQLRNPISRIYAKTLLLLLPLLFTCVAFSPVDWDFAIAFNRTAPFYLIGIMVFALYRTIRAIPDSIWSPAAWLPIQTAIFFGFGPLVEVYGNFETQLRLTVHKIDITETELFRAHTLSVVGVFGVMLGFWLHTVLRERDWRRALDARTHPRLPVLSTGTLALLFIAGGMVLRYAIIRPSQWGMIDILIPGVFTTITSIVDVGFALAAYLATRGDKRMRWLLLLVWPAHLFLTSLSFAKSEFMLALLLPAIGAYIGHRKVRRLAAAVLTIAVIYSFSQDFSSFGRAIIHANSGTIGYGDRVKIVGRYFTEWSDSTLLDSSDHEEDWWMRLNHANVQAAGMRFYDAGMPGTSLGNAWTFFIPRAVWPSKPVYIGPGDAFREQVTGQSGGGFMALSVYGDLYWEFGWLGVVLISPLVGWFFGMMTWRSIEVVAHRDFIYLPAVLIALQTTVLGLTRFLVNGIIAAIPMYFSYVLVVHLLSRFLKAEQKWLREAHPDIVRPGAAAAR